MSFLTPLFLLGGLAIAFPVIFHLIRRTTRERTSFSSLMFLQASPPRLTRRSKLEHILLLVLRCAVLCLLALGFARPFIKKAINPPAQSAKARQIVVLLDTSASMRRATLWEDARARVQSILGKISPADQLALYAFDRHVRPLITFEQWNATPIGARAALGSEKLAEISPGWSATDLGIALVTAGEALADSTGKAPASIRQVVLVSDLQEGSHIELLQGYEWPKGVQVLIEPLHSRHANNASIQLVTSPEEGSNPSDSANVRLRVSNAAASKREQFKLGWALTDGRTFVGKPIELYVPAGQSRTVRLPAQSGAAAADRIILQGDDDDFDNTVFVVPAEKSHLTVLYYGNDSESDPRSAAYFLKRAFQETRQQAVQVLVRGENVPLSPSDVQSASLIIVTSKLAEETSRALKEQVAQGKMLLFSLASPDSASTLAPLLGLPQLSVE